MSDLLVIPEETPEDLKLQKEVQKLTDQARESHLTKTFGDNVPTINIDRVETDKNGDAILDDAAQPVFKDYIAFPITTDVLNYLYGMCKSLLVNRMIPEPEGMIELMGKLAKCQNVSSPIRSYTAELPINYFVGTIKSVQLALKTGMVGDTKTREVLEELYINWMERLRAHHNLREKEETMKKPPEEIKTLVKKGEYY